MASRWFERDGGFCCRNLAAVLACVLLTVCAGPPGAVHWVKAGVDDTATAQEIADCRVQANAAQNSALGINQDISATLGRNWELSNTTRLQDQTIRRQAAGVADQTFDNCMRAKGFTKTG